MNLFRTGLLFLTFSFSLHAGLLHQAIWQGDLQKVIDLLKQCPDLNEKDEEGNTALHIAAELGNAEMIEVLVEAKSDQGLANLRGETPFRSAILARQSTAMRILCPSTLNWTERLSIFRSYVMDEDFDELDTGNIFIDFQLAQQGFPVTHSQDPETVELLNHLGVQFGADRGDNWGLSYEDIHFIEDLIRDLEEWMAEIKKNRQSFEIILSAKNRVYRSLYDRFIALPRDLEEDWTTDPILTELEALLIKDIPLLSKRQSSVVQVIRSLDRFDNSYLKLFLQIVRMMSAKPLDLSALEETLKLLKRRFKFDKTLVPLVYIYRTVVILGDRPDDTSEFNVLEQDYVWNLFNQLSVWIQGLPGFSSGIPHEHRRFSESDFYNAIPWESFVNLGMALRRRIWNPKNGSDFYIQAIPRLLREAKELILPLRALLDSESELPTSIPNVTIDFTALGTVAFFQSDITAVRAVLKTLKSLESLKALDPNALSSRDRFAILRSIEVLGESFKNMSPALKAKFGAAWDDKMRSFKVGRNFFGHLNRAQGWKKVKELVGSIHGKQILAQLVSEDFVKLQNLFKNLYREMLPHLMSQELSSFYGAQVQFPDDFHLSAIRQIIYVLDSWIRPSERDDLCQEFKIEQGLICVAIKDLESAITSGVLIERERWEKYLAQLPVSKNAKKDLAYYFKGNDKTEKGKAKALKILTGLRPASPDSDPNEMIDALEEPLAFDIFVQKMMNLGVMVPNKWEEVHKRLRAFETKKAALAQAAPELLESDLEADAVRDAKAILEVIEEIKAILPQRYVDALLSLMTINSLLSKQVSDIEKRYKVSEILKSINFEFRHNPNINFFQASRLKIPQNYLDERKPLNDRIEAFYQVFESLNDALEKDALTHMALVFLISSFRSSASSVGEYLNQVSGYILGFDRFDWEGKAQELLYSVHEANGYMHLRDVMEEKVSSQKRLLAIALKLAFGIIKPEPVDGIISFDNGDSWTKILNNFISIVEGSELDSSQSAAASASVEESKLDSSQSAASASQSPVQPQWYGDQQVAQTLELRLQEAGLDLRREDLVVMPALGGTAEGQQIRTHLEMERDRHAQVSSRTILMPYNINNVHWIGIVIRIDTGVHVDMIDTLGARANIPAYLWRELRQVYPQAEINLLEDLTQTDNHSCGPMMIENLVRRARFLFNISEQTFLPTNATEIRTYHETLLDTWTTGFAMMPPLTPQSR